MGYAKWKEKALEDFENLPLHHFMGVKVVETATGSAVLRLPLHKNIVNAAGILHGIMHHALCDMAASIAAWATLGDEPLLVTSNVNVAVLASTSSGEITARAQMIRAGKRQLVLETRLYDDNNTLLSVGQVTKMVLERKTEQC